MTEKTKAQRGASIQMEIDTERWAATKDNKDFCGGYGDSPWGYLYTIAKTAACDTLHNGGTLVIVSGGGKVTIIQRPDVEEGL